MRFHLKEILHVPGASLPFVSQLDLSDLDFYGERPFAHPIVIHGTVRNMAGALMLEGSADTTLELVCDRCLKPFRQELRLPVSTLLAETLEDEENDEIVLLEDGAVDLDEVFTTALVLSMDSKHVCDQDCKGLCATCGANLNEGPCGCRKEIDPRLAALAQLLDKDE